MPQLQTPDEHVRTPRRASNSDSIINQDAPKTKKSQWAHEEDAVSVQTHALALTS